MSKSDKSLGSVAPQPASEAPQAIIHEEPKKGGSYVRNVSTGALQQPVEPANKQDQE